MRNGHARALVLSLVLIVAVFVGAFALSSQARQVPVLRTLDEPGPTGIEADEPLYPGLIDNETLAISRSLALFPPEHNPHGAIARLVSRYTYEIWASGPGPTPPPSMQDWSWADPTSPVWLVAVLGDDVTTADLVTSPVGPTELDFDPRPAEGAAFAWDAGSGLLLGVIGLSPTLIPGGDYAYLAALSNEPLAIVPATEIPTLCAVQPDATCTPEPTQAPATP